MNVQAQLAKGSFQCHCGRVHQCDTALLRIERGVLKELGTILAGFHHVLVISDGNTRPLCGQAVIQVLKDQGFTVDEAFFNQKTVLVPDEKAIAAVEAVYMEGTQAIIGVGSGVINDLSKYIAFTHGIPSMIVATAPSMDGFASSGAVMMLGGFKVTCPRKAPRWIVGDIDILTAAPMEMIRSGIGDILGKYSALSDWKLAHILSKDPMCDLIYQMVEEELETCVDNIPKIMERDPDAIGRLMESLAIVGISLAYQGSSRPASGSEHLISHFFELTSIMKNKPYFPHGIDVGYAAVIAEILRKQLLQEDPGTFATDFNRREWEAGLQKVFGEMAEDIITLQDDAKTYTTDRSALIRENWEAIQNILGQTPGVEFIVEKLEAAGFHLDEFIALYGWESIRNGILYATDLKTRYTLLELLSDTGYLKRYATALKF